MSLSVKFCGAAGTVTGSMYYLEYTHGGQVFKFCVDAGMFQTADEIEEYWMNANLFFDPKEVEALVLTHAHLDHIGRLPYLHHEGFRGTVYSTAATKDIGQIIMEDSAKQMARKWKDAQFASNLGTKNEIKAKPLYDEKDATGALKLFDTVPYNSPVDIHPNLSVEFYNAGHILGSSWFVLTEKDSGKKVVFSGDIGNHDKPFIEDPKIVPKGFDGLTHIFCETTYGDRSHKDSLVKNQLRDILRDTEKRGGIAMIASFAVQRSQELIYILAELMEEGKIPRSQIYLDSPMAGKVTDVFKNHVELYDKPALEKTKRDGNPLDYENLEVLLTSFESKALNYEKDYFVVIAGSGMVNGGRIIKHLKAHGKKPRNSLILVGYCAEGTHGREILEGAEVIEEDGKDIKINCHVHKLEAFSGHGDNNMLYKWISALPSQRAIRGEEEVGVFLVHGDPSSSEVFKKRISETLFKAENVHLPKLEEVRFLWE